MRAWPLSLIVQDVQRLGQVVMKQLAPPPPGRAYREAFASRYERSSVAYAAKAYLGRWLAALIAEEGLGMDVVSGGELAVAKAAGLPMGRVLFHGNNKSATEVREAVAA